jgi:hypothetical protein
MVVHSCWCICFIGMSAQGLNSKVHLNSNRFGFQKGLEKEKGKEIREGSPTCLPSSPWAGPFPPHRPTLSHSLSSPLTRPPFPAAHSPLFSPSHGPLSSLLRATRSAQFSLSL